MKQKTLKLMMVALGVLLSINANAYDVEVNGIYYTLWKSNKTASVTYVPTEGNAYAGDIIIPKEIIANDVTYLVTTIGINAFKGCSDLTSVTIPESVTSIDAAAFEGCSGLTSITIQAETPPSVDAGGLGVSQKVLLYVQKGLQSIYESADGWKKFTVVEPYYVLTYMVDDEVYKTMEMGYGESITSIDKPAKEGYTFSGWKGISVKIANGVKRIGGAAFEDCVNMLSIDIPNSVTVIEAAAFSGCESLAALLIPEGVTELGVYFAEYCESLTSIEIPASVTIIDDFAFRDCRNLKTLTIPNSVEYIGTEAFSGCGELTDVYCYAEKVPTTESDAFADCYIDYETLHVPEEALGKYKAREPWKQFGYIVPIEEAPQTYTLTYMLDGILYKKYELEKGAKIKTEDEPVKEGYTFSGWSEIPATMPANDVTVTGTFIVNSYTLTYMVDDEVYKTYTVEYGATVEEEAAPEKEGYIFSGWSETLGTMPAHDVTITGNFTFVDGIAGVGMDDKTDGIYTLDGRKIEKLQKGVNIIRNGKEVKKVFVK
ncbi:MAG: leucine-rich repeat protein [Bacteroidaceae bacterium]|nr:leucine-rich repeat protein [Bacteroidaceae bacterium]